MKNAVWWFASGIWTANAFNSAFDGYAIIALFSASVAVWTWLVAAGVIWAEE